MRWSCRSRGRPVRVGGLIATRAPGFTETDRTGWARPALCHCGYAVQPGWTGTVPPRDSAITPARYQALLGQRATGTVLSRHAGSLRVEAPHGAVICLWDGATTIRYVGDGTAAMVDYPPGHPGDSSNGRRGGAVFTRGDRHTTGWLTPYNGLA